MQLVIGNKNYSSWSMRPWILLRHFGVPFEEIRVPLFEPGYQERLKPYSPTLRVPVLIDGPLRIWDSLAICEYLSEKHLAGAALPAGEDDRALCRSCCSEMHAGFMAIRNELPMNCRARKRLSLSPAVRAESRRVDELWSEFRTQHAGQGDYLFGQFSMADCFFAPVAMRFQTYGVELSPRAERYMTTLLRTEALEQWKSEAQNETEVLAEFEIGIEIDS